MGRLYFEFQYEENSPKVTLTMAPDATLDEVFEQFQGFLTAAGYCFSQDDFVGVISSVPESVEQN